MTPESKAPAFSGSVPEVYEKELVPLLFDQYAEDLGARIAALSPRAVLETACGTGIATRAILRRLPPGARLMATDLQQPMIDVARRETPADPRLEWRAADMTALPFEEGAFDALACQYGMMFPPDKPAAFAEARRVIRPGGAFVFNVWDSFDENPPAAVAQRVIDELFPKDPPRFYHTPWGFHDRALLSKLTRDAGFPGATIEVVRFAVERPNARTAARALVEGTPIYSQIVDHATVPVEHVVATMERAFARSFGDAPFRSHIQALVVTARA